VTRGAWSIVLASGLLFFAIGWALLQNGHPHEDAYILFKYVRMWASGEGIVYYPGGLHTEGATDFGWLVLLTALYRVGFDAAVAALACNALGAALASFALLSLVRWRERPGRERVLFGTLAALIPVLPAAHAAYVGFSSMLYSALTLLSIALFVHHSARLRVLLPVLGLAVALMRPDGVLLAAGFVALGAVRASRDGSLRRYMQCAGAAALVGIAYFALRVGYFGELLPLPLTVKSHSPEAWPGMAPNWKWLTGRAPELSVLALVAWGVRDSSAERRRLGAALLPGALLFAALVFAMQSQNVGSRFQAPVLISIHGVLLALAALPSRLPRGRHLLLVGVACALFAARDARGFWLYTWQPATQAEYIDGYANALPHCISPEDHIALTEAGRIAFWSESRLSDLVGLNSVRFAHTPPTARLIAEDAPDIVLLHHAGALRTDGLQPWVAAAHASGGSYKTATHAPVQMAAAAGLTFLVEHADEYEVYAVRYRGGLNHVWAIRADHPALECFVRTLRDSFAHAPSYADLAW